MTSAAPVFSSRFTEALLFAVDVHGAQRRKTSTGLSDGPSYLGHLLGVAALVIEDGGSETEVVAALLHDTLEDTETTDQDLRRLFGAEVEAIVVGCTDSQQTPKPPWRERKERYLEHLSAASPSVLRVATADKLYNARTILMDLRRHGDEVWGRFSGGRQGVLWYYGSLRSILVACNPGPPANELARVVSQIKDYQSNP